MSKWIKKDLFEDFKKEKIEEKDTSTGGFRRSDLLWETPDKGSVEQAKVYEGRFVPDPKGEFYKRYYYHFWQSGETWKFVLCPKTDDFKNYCPFCSAVSKLYSGTKQDKSHAYNLKRKEKFVGNWYVTKDPRDSDRDEEKKVIGKIKLYEFPGKIEQKLKKEITTDNDQGYGVQIFDPSEEGRNFILNVLSTKKQEDGKQWPDYSSSEFSRMQSALGTDDEIEELMKTCTDLIEYVGSMETSKEKQVDLLKAEFLWELVESECLAKGYEDAETGGTPKEEPKKEPKKDHDSFDTGEKAKEKAKEKTKEEKKEPPKEKPADEVDGLDDDDLLAELDNM